MNGIHQNDVFERLTVLGFSHRDSNSMPHFRVRCCCGTVKTVRGDKLKNVTTRSCGCLARELASQRYKEINAKRWHKGKAAS